MAENTIWQALLAFQKEAPKLLKTETGMHNAKYAPLEKIQEVINPILHKHKLGYTQQLTHIEGEPALRTIVFNELGETIEDVTPLILPKQDPQGQGSAITYARRYALGASLGLVIDKDDDGDSATVSVQSSGSYTASPNKEASPKQKNFILKMFKELAPDSDFISWYKEEYGAEAKDMTSARASEVIERMQKRMQRGDV